MISHEIAEIIFNVLSAIFYAIRSNFQFLLMMHHLTDTIYKNKSMKFPGMYRKIMHTTDNLPNTNPERWVPVSSWMMRVSLDGKLTVGEPSELEPPTAGARDSRSTRITSCCSWEVFQVSCVACRKVMA